MRTSVNARQDVAVYFVGDGRVFWYFHFIFVLIIACVNFWLDSRMYVCFACVHIGCFLVQCWLSWELPSSMCYSRIDMFNFWLNWELPSSMCFNIIFCFSYLVELVVEHS